MDNMKAEQHKKYKDLTKEARKLLLKEFHGEVETRYKIFLWSGIALLPLVLICGGFSAYYLVNILFTNVVAFQFYIFAAMFNVACGGVLLLRSKYDKRLRTWLKEKKNIFYE